MYDLSGSHASPDGGVQHLQHRNLTSGSYAASPGLARTNSSRAAALGSPAENPAKVLFQDGEGQKGLEGNDSLCPRRKVSRGLTATLVYAAAILERADETILPAVYLVRLRFRARGGRRGARGASVESGRSSQAISWGRHIDPFPLPPFSCHQKVVFFRGGFRRERALQLAVSTSVECRG